MIRIWRRHYDPVAVEAALVATKELEPRSLGSRGPLGALDDSFTEYDDRCQALWRISTVRQFQPSVLRSLTTDEILFLAGQRSDDFPDERLDWVARNKIAQNTARAGAELGRRARNAGLWQSIALLILGVAVGVAGALVQRAL